MKPGELPRTGESGARKKCGHIGRCAGSRGGRKVGLKSGGDRASRCDCVLEGKGVPGLGGRTLMSQ